ncbi:DNA-binding protein [Sodalis sp. RH19]|uniref:YobI family P-loop NTPase n=1 Tax=Sodalis sp. RH19 TaxID=3394334 RepID=UPI0039B37FF7
MILSCRIKGLFSKIQTYFRRQPVIESAEDDVTYDTLTPKIITDERVREYFKALDFAFSKKDTKNIAITGPYGAGKSTVILSYLNTRYENGYINVSLADFDISEKGNKQPHENAEVELSILQQILYKESRENLPDSRIDRIQNRNKKHIISLFISSLGIVVPLSLFFLSVFTPKILTFFGAEADNILYFKSIYLLRFGLSSVFALITLFSIVSVASKAGIFDKKLKLSKIAFLQGSADITTQDSPSLLNNCMDEIVYFFSRTRRKIVVFEDLDRLGNTEVFVKLREINQIVNNNIGSEPVRFVYACRDDIFLGADVRTKFFDFILPIIPIMDSRNAYTHLKNKLKDFPVAEDSLLKQTSLYISDMRSLQNIANEFNLFKQVVDNNHNDAKIFALVFYKNLYAQDYNLVDKKSGVLYSFINDYRQRKLHEEYFSSLDDKLDKLSIKLEIIKKEKATSDSDVREEIICRYVSKELWSIVNFALAENSYSSKTYYNADGLCVNQSDFVSFFSSSKKTYIGLIDKRYGDHYIEFGKSNVIDEYNRRAVLVASGRDAEYKKILSEIEMVKENIRTRNAISLSELTKLIGWVKFKELAEQYFESMNDPDIIGEEQLKTIRSGLRHGGFEALYYLLANGFLMQDFMMFRSIFQEGSISVNDNDYIKSVGRYISCEEANDNYSLDNEKEVLAELVSQHFIYREGAIHHQVVAYMLNNCISNLDEMISAIFNKYSTKIIPVFTVLDTKFVQPSLFVQFIKAALEENRYLDKMVSVLEESGTGVIQTKITVNMIAYVSLKASIQRNKYQTFVKNRGYGIISSLDAATINPFLDNIKSLGVVYDEVALPVVDIEYQALKFVANNFMYTFTKSNYRIVVSALLENKNIDCEQVDKTPFSLINEHQLNTVREYVDNNIDTFVRDIFIDSEEDSATVVKMLKHPALSDALRIEILKNMTFTVSDLGRFTEAVDVGEDLLSYHDMFYRYDRVAPSWETLLAYIYEDCNQDVLTGYIEQHAIYLSNRDAGVVDGANYDLLYMKVICNDKLSDSAYAEAMKSVYINIHEFDERLSIDNFNRLVKNNKLTLDSDVFDKISELFIKLNEVAVVEVFVNWFSKNKEEFFRDTNYYLHSSAEDTFLEKMLQAINNSDKFNTKEKATLLVRYHDKYNASFLDNLATSHEVMQSIIAISDNDSLKIKIIIKLLDASYNRRADVAVLVEYLSEKEYSKIFNQKYKATLTLVNIEEASSLLAAFQNKDLIKKWSIRDDGRFSIEIRPDLNEEVFLD